MISAARGAAGSRSATGGPNGAVVYEGVLEQGKSLHFTLGHTLWVRMGRPANALDVSLGGRLVERPARRPGQRAAHLERRRSA